MSNDTKNDAKDYLELLIDIKNEGISGMIKNISPNDLSGLKFYKFLVSSPTNVLFALLDKKEYEDKLFSKFTAAGVPNNIAREQAERFAILHAMLKTTLTIGSGVAFGGFTGVGAAFAAGQAYDKNFEEINEALGINQVMHNLKQAPVETAQNINEKTKNLANHYQEIEQKNEQAIKKGQVLKDKAKQFSEQAKRTEDVLDETVKFWSENLETDPTVGQGIKHEARKLAEEYQSANDKPKAFAQFQQQLIEKLEQEQQFDALIATGRELSFFLSQTAILTKDKNVARVATGIGAAAQMMEGIKVASAGIGVMSTVTTSGALLSTLPTLFSGFGMVVGAISVFSMLFNDDDGADAGAEAYTALYSTMIAMWESINHNFEITFGKLDAIIDGMNEMERNNWVRLKLMLKSIEDARSDIKDKIQGVKEEIKELRTAVTSYLNVIVDNDIVNLIEKILVATDDDILRNYDTYTATISTWCRNQLSLTDRTGKANTVDGQIVFSSNALINQLNQSLTQETWKEFDLKLGLFQSLAKSVNGNLNVDRLDLINPKDLDKVIDVYCRLIKIVAMDILSKADKESPRKYKNQLIKIKKFVDDMIIFFENIAASPELLKNLINNYQNHFNKLIFQIQMLQPQAPEKISVLLSWNLLQDAKTNLEAFAKLGNAQAIANEITKNVTWVNAPMKRRNDGLVAPGHGGDPWYQVPEGEINNIVFTQKQYDALISQPLIKNQFDTIRSNLTFAISNLYVNASPVVVYTPMYMSAPLTAMGREGAIAILKYYNFAISIFYQPAIKIGAIEYPFAQGNFYSAEALKLTGRDIYTLAFDSYTSLKSSLQNSNLKASASSFYTREDYQQALADPLYQELESKVLKPLRTSIVADLFDQTIAYEDFIKNISKDYLALVAVLKLIDPSFNHTYTPSIFKRFEAAAKNLYSTGSVEDLNAFWMNITGTCPKTRVIRPVWQEEFRDYMGNPDEITETKLYEKVKSSLAQHPLLIKMKALQARLTQTADFIDPEKNAAHAKRRLKIIQDKAASQQQTFIEMMQTINASIESIASLSNGLGADEFTPLYKISQELMAQINQQFKADNEKTRTVNNKPKTPTPGLTTALQKLCDDPEVDLTDVIIVLRHLEKENILEDTLDMPDLIARPLTLAIKSGRDDVVKLLLDFDAKVEPSMLNFIDADLDHSVSIKIESLINFYHAMQQLDDMQFGRTIGLIKEGMIGMQQAYRDNKGKFDVVDMFPGTTGGGKSVSINVMAGVTYTSYTDDKGDERLRVVGTKVEVTPSASSTESETSYPRMVPMQNTYAVDLQGYRDTRGIPYQVAGGVCAQMLPKVVNNIRGICLVISSKKLFGDNFADVQDSFENIANLVNNNQNILDNVVIFINKAKDGDNVDKIMNRLASFSKGNKKIPSKVKFVLQNISREQIIVAKMPDDTFRKTLLAKFNTMSPIPVSELDFSSYHNQADTFKKMFDQLLKHRSAVCDDAILLRNFSVKSHAQLLKNTLKNLHELKLMNANEKLGDPASEQKLQEAQDLLKQQQEYRVKLIDLLEKKLIPFLQNHFEVDQNIQTKSSDNINRDIELYLQELTVANELVQYIRDITDQLDIKIPPLDSFCLSEDLEQNAPEFFALKNRKSPPSICEVDVFGVQGACAQEVYDESLPATSSASRTALPLGLAAMSAFYNMFLRSNPEPEVTQTIKHGWKIAQKKTHNSQTFNYEKQPALTPAAGLIPMGVKTCEVDIQINGQDPVYAQQIDTIIGMESGNITANPSCTFEDMAFVNQDLKQRLPSYETRIQQEQLKEFASGLSVNAATTAASSGIILLVRDIFLSEGYSPKVADWASYFVAQGMSVVRVGYSIYNGIDFLTATLPMAASNAVYYGLTKTGLMQERHASISSNVVGLVTSSYMGGGLIHTAAHMGVSSMATYLISIGEKNFAQQYLTGYLSQRCDELKYLRDALAVYLNEEEKRLLDDGLNKFYTKVKANPEMQDYVTAYDFKEKLESILQSLQANNRNVFKSNAF